MVQLQISQKLTGSNAHAALAATHLGQAHIAGTGPENATCSGCKLWGVWKKVKRANGDIDKVLTDPGKYSAKHKEKPSQRKAGACTKPIANKSTRKVPPDARACRFFEPKGGDA